MYYIKHRHKAILFAIFEDKERAQKWIDKFNPSHYTDKTLKKGDLYIESRHIL